MSQPQTIREYLANFNASLAVGFRSRRRIFLEVYDHLSQRIERELRDGVSRAVAEQRAIAAFGSPEEVARSFQAGFVGALDRQLALSTRRLHMWMAAHRWGAAVMRMALLTLILGAVAAVGALADASYPLSVLVWVFWGLMWVLWLSPQAPLRGRTRAGAGARPWRRLGVGRELRAAPTPILLAMCPYPVVSVWMTMVEGEDLYRPFWRIMIVVLLFTGFQQGVAWATDRAVDRAARRHAPAAEDAGRPSWQAEHPGKAALFEIWSVPLASLALILIYPAPLELRGAFTVLSAALTALLAISLCLNRSLKQQGSYARSLEEPT